MNKKIDDDLYFLEEIVKTPSPSGYEELVAKKIGEFALSFSDLIETDKLGSVHVTIKGQEKKIKIMLASHIDEVGLIIKYIDEEGFIYFDTLGNVDAAILPGMNVEIHACSGVLRGVIGRKAIHFLTDEERKNVMPINHLFIDTGLSCDELRKRVTIGDSVTFESNFFSLGNGFIVGRGLDDKVGVWISLMVLRRIKKSSKIHGDIVFAGTVQEELGLRGGTASAYSINPKIGLCVEVINATDYPTTDKHKYGDFKCGYGPVIGRGPNISPIAFDYLVKAAQKADCIYQIGAEPRATGTDANAIQLSRGGKMVGLISIPLRYMHTNIEMVNKKDLFAAVTIIEEFIFLISDEIN